MAIQFCPTQQVLHLTRGCRTSRYRFASILRLLFFETDQHTFRKTTSSNGHFIYLPINYLVHFHCISLTNSHVKYFRTYYDYSSFDQVLLAKSRLTSRDFCHHLLKLYILFADNTKQQRWPPRPASTICMTTPSPRPSCVIPQATRISTIDRASWVLIPRDDSTDDGHGGGISHLKFRQTNNFSREYFYYGYSMFYLSIWLKVVAGRPRAKEQTNVIK